MAIPTLPNRGRLEKKPVSGKFHSVVEPRYLTLDEASDLYRATQGDLEAFKLVSIQDVENLVEAETFAEFVSQNQGNFIVTGINYDYLL